MLHSLRTPILASCLALAFAACGGGSSTPQKNDGGTSTDGPKVQFDGGTSTQQDGGTSTQQDGGTTGACVPTGGQAIGAICKASKPCTCPNDCVDPGEATLAGSCWPKPDPTNGCANATDAAIYFDNPDNAHCFPTATISGTFSVPIGTQSTIGGTLNLTVSINGITTTLTQGWSQFDSTNNRWRIYLMPASLSTPPINYLSLLVDAADYKTTAAIDFSTNQNSFGALLQENSTSMLIEAMTMEGTLSFTTADTGSTGTTAGTFNNVSIYFFPVELCGPNTSAC